MSKYYSINEFSKVLGVSAQTLRNWDNKGKLHPHHTSKARKLVKELIEGGDEIDKVN